MSVSLEKLVSLTRSRVARIWSNRGFYLLLVGYKLGTLESGRTMPMSGKAEEAQMHGLWLGNSTPSTLKTLLVTVIGAM